MIITNSVKRLVNCIGEINDSFLEEAESADIAYNEATRKRFVRYSALAAFGFAMTYWLFYSKRTASTTSVISNKSA